MGLPQLDVVKAHKDYLMMAAMLIMPVKTMTLLVIPKLLRRFISFKWRYSSFVIREVVSKFLHSDMSYYCFQNLDFID